ncbi:MAG: hypothetical protein GX780_02260 [Campylobacteraceae bacterium]|nr:hypothetical protein [Campylobacteraceae bacterium]
MEKLHYEISPEFAHLEEFVLEVKSHFKQSNKTIHKARNELKTLTINDENFVVKSFKIPKAFQKFIYSFCKNSKAKTSFLNALSLKKLEITTPDPVAFIEFYENGFLKESYFIAKEWKYDFTIREPLLDANFPEKETLLKAFATFVYKLHEKHIIHKDLSPGNILIKKAKLQMCVVDINRMKFAPLSLNQRLKNFAKLWAKDEDLKTIIKHYALLSNIDEKKAIFLALKASHQLKAKINFKKRLKGIKVVD